MFISVIVDICRDQNLRNVVLESFENLFFSYKTFFSVKNLVGDEIWRGKVSFDKFFLSNEQDVKVCLDFFVKICSNFSLQSLTLSLWMMITFPLLGKI